MSQTGDTDFLGATGGDAYSARIQLQKLLLELVKRFEGGFEELAAAIIKANDGVTPRGLDRRKLSNLAQGKADSLSLEAMDALNKYLIKEGGIGLASIFTSPNLIEEVAQRGKVTFVIGAKHRERNTAVSLWDFRCIERIMRGIYRTAPMTQLDFQDVPLPLPSGPADRTSGHSATELMDDWEGLLVAPLGPSLICLGSQRACRATESFLIKMFEAQLGPHATASTAPVPFSFIWSAQRPDEYHSSFTLTPGDVGEAGRSINARDWHTWGIHVPDGTGMTSSKTYWVERRGTRWLSYGIVAAQRRPQGQVWLVLSGLSGPETFAGAKVMVSISKALPVADASQPSRVVWALYQADIGDQPLQRLGDGRKLLDQRLLYQGYWPP